MAWIADVTWHIERAAHLVGLALAPALVSPDPWLEGRSRAWGAAAGLGLAAALYGASRLRAGLETREAKAAFWLVGLAIASAFAGELYTARAGAPLGAAIAPVAALTWIALATVAAALGGRYLGSSFKHKRTGAAVVVLALGLLQLSDAGPTLASADAMWWRALRLDPAHERAADAIVTPLVRAKKLDEARKAASRCAREQPASCTCRALAVEVAVAERNASAAVEAGKKALDRCPASPRVVADLAVALALAGDGPTAEARAREGLEAAGDGDARLHYALALALHARGQLREALDETQRAIDLGYGRDAELLAGALAIVFGDEAAAKGWLEPLAKDAAPDGDALYNLALLADKRGDYNAAREGYIAALKADRSLANARYNLVHLTHRHGVAAESQHHARTFVESYPSDPRGPDLLRLTGATTP
jgi:tetratricopeptide (TPR) repeat protein